MKLLRTMSCSCFEENCSVELNLYSFAGTTESMRTQMKSWHRSLLCKNVAVPPWTSSVCRMIPLLELEIKIASEATIAYERCTSVSELFCGVRLSSEPFIPGPLAFVRRAVAVYPTCIIWDLRNSYGVTLCNLWCHQLDDAAACFPGPFALEGQSRYSCFAASCFLEFIK